MVGRSWDVFQPLLFGLIGAEIVIETLEPVTVGKNQNFALIVSSVLFTVFHLQWLFSDSSDFSDSLRQHTAQSEVLHMCSQL